MLSSPLSILLGLNSYRRHRSSFNQTNTSATVTVPDAVDNYLRADAESSSRATDAQVEDTTVRRQKTKPSGKSR